MTEKKPFISTMLFVLMGRAGVVIVSFLIAFFLGAGPATDAFFFSYAVIFALQNIFAHIFESTLVPFIVERKNDPGRAFAFTVKAAKRALPVCLVFGLLAGFGLQGLPQYLPAVHPETSALMSRLYWEMLPGLLLAALIAAYQGYFYAYKNFWFPAVSTLVRTLTMAAFFLAFKDRIGVQSLTYGFTAGEALRWFWAHRLLAGNRPAAFAAGADGTAEIKEFLGQAFFQIIALAAVNAMPLADQWAAAPLGAGSLSLFNYGDRLLQVPYLLFFYGFTQIFLSFWSESHARDEFPMFIGKVQKDVRLVLAGGFALVAVLWLAAEPAVRLIFTKTSLTAEQLRQVTDIFRWLTIGFLPGILRILYGRVMIIIRESKFYSFQAWAELMGKIILNYLFAARFGVAGLAMATAVIYSLTALWLYLYLNKRVRAGSSAR